MEIIRERGIKLKTKSNLKEVDTKRCLATFEHLDENNRPTGETMVLEV
jgi:hypothetical protein